MIKLRHAVPCGPFKRISPLPVPPLLESFNADTSASMQFDADTYQATVVHQNTQCGNCHVSPIRGVRFACFNCDMDLCAVCEDRDEVRRQHTASHVFVQVSTVRQRV